MLDFLALVLGREAMQRELDGNQPVIVEATSRRSTARVPVVRRRAAATLRRLADHLEPVGEIGRAHH